MTLQANGLNGIQDFSALTDLSEPIYSLLDKLDIFDVNYVDVSQVTLERVTDGADDIVAKSRNGERNYASRETAKSVILALPFFPIDIVIKASEIQDFREFLTGNTSETLLKRVMRATKKISKSHAKLKRKAMYAALKGDTYTGVANHNLNKNFATLWDVAGSVTTADVDFSVLASNPSTEMEAARKHIQDNAQDEAGAYNLIALCGATWFNAYYDHPLVNDDLYGDGKAVERVGGNIVERSFQHKGVTFYLDASGEIADGDAIIMPTGIDDMFMLTYGPPNTLAGHEEEITEVYTFLVEDVRKVTMESETAFLCSNTRPELVIKSTGTFA